MERGWWGRDEQTRKGGKDGCGRKGNKRNKVS